MAVQADQSVPSIVHISQAACNDVTFTKYVTLPQGSTVIMDRGYRDYRQYNAWGDQQMRWITRTHPNTYYEYLESFQVSSDQHQKGVQKDERVRLGYPTKRISKVNCRLISYIAPNGKHFEFITNDFYSEPIVIAQLYQKRWSIELLFKRLKQNMPYYFLGDNQNAIRIQIWCALIADFVLQIVRKQVKHKWAFSTIVSVIRLQLFNYLNLYSFLENPERCIIQTIPNQQQLNLNLSG